MLRSIGMTRGGVLKMLDYECLICGLKSIILGFAASIPLCYFIHKEVTSYTHMSFYIPWQSILIACCSVFVVVFATMFYTAGRLKGDHLTEVIRSEAL